MPFGSFVLIYFGHNGGGIKMDDVGSMMEDVVARLRELTDVDFERDSTKPESELSSLCSLLSQFIEDEMRSCSMDVGGITPEYVQRAWGGRVAKEDIEAAFEALKRNDDLLCIGK